MHNKNLRRLSWAAAIAATAGLIGLNPAQAGDKTWDFSSAPADLLISGNNDAVYRDAGGNPGGFLALTYPENSQSAAIAFPNLDPGKIVTGFTFTCDLRVGNSTGDRAADGFSISFVRDGDPFLVDVTDGDGTFADTTMGGNCCAETGSKTGIAVSFDTWSGNTFPTDPNDQTDIEGIIVRVDNVTVQKVALPTRHGAPDDNTSLQTGPRDATYWANGGDPRAPESWATLAWRPFTINLTTQGQLTVTWKGRTILDNFQTTYFPSAGQIVFAGRTGGANEHTHVDNIRLTTIAEAVTAVPGAPPNLRVGEVGSRRALIQWDAATVTGDPNARIAYEVERNGVVIAPQLTTLSFEDRGLQPGTAYTYKVRGKNIAGLAGPDSTVAANTVQDVPGVAFLKAEQWNNIAGGTYDAGLNDPHYSDPPDAIHYINGFSFGETSNFGNTWGENMFVKITGVLTVPEAGSYRFFIRSDDGSALFVNSTGAAIPDPTATTPVAIESTCCGAFEDVDEFGTTPEVTTEPIAFTKGQQVGITFVVKEGGGGDWGQVAIRKEGDPTPAGQLTPLRGAVLASPVDAVGATIAITTQPTAQTVSANSPVSFTVAATGSSPYGGDYGNVISYQWYVNGDAVLGANSATYSINVTPASLNNAKVKVVAAVAGASVTSSEVTLTVNPDTVAPTVAEVSGSDGFNSITFVFSEPVTDPSATTVANYTVTGLTLSNPVRVNDRTVRFTTTRQAENTQYPVTVNGVRDNANLASAFTGTFTSFKFQSGIAVFNLWNNQTGGFETFPDCCADAAPTETRIVNEYYTGSGLFENYFGQLKGVFVPEETGDYVFFVASDDHGELYLSTDADPANKKRIAVEPSWSDPRLWVGDGTASNTATRGEVGSRQNRSDEYPDTEWSTGAGGKITLTKGNRYYLEVLYKEGGGGDHGAATFKLASAADPANGATALNGGKIGWFIDPNKIAPIITRRPTTVKFAAGQTIEFSVEAESATPVTYQWYQNKRAIPGATSATLTIPNAGVLNVGDYYVDVSNRNGTASSFPDNDSRAIMTGAFVIEAEDYNYEAGKTVAAASTMPLAADLYKGKDGLPGIDFVNNTPSGGADDANGNSLRNGWVENGTVFPSPPGAGGNLDVIIDNGGGNTERPDFTLANNYKIGWGGTGNWWNYTRNFAPGQYNAVWVGSRDGRDNNVMSRTLEIVTGDPTKADAATTVVGELTANGTGAWSSNDSIPFLTPGGATAATFTLGANTTLRLRISAGDGDNDYILFYPAGAAPTNPVITGLVVNPNGSITITWTGGGQLEASATLNGAYAPVPGATGGTFTWTPGANDNVVFVRVRN